MNIADLLKLNVNEHTERKNGLTYLSWAWAWAEALKADPAASFAVQMFNDEPLCRIGKTALVFVTVTLFGKPMTCQLPVMDHRNKAIPDPDAFAVNTAIMRCMTKALALHGIGLYIYAGEDLPDGDPADEPAKEAPKRGKPPVNQDGGGAISPRKLIFDGLQPDVQTAIRRAVPQVEAAMPNAEKATDVILMVAEEWTEHADLNDIKAGFAYLLLPATSAALKKHSQAVNA